MIGSAEAAPAGDNDIDLVVLTMPGGGDTRIELAGSAPAEISHTGNVVVAIGDDVVTDTRVVADAKRLATLLDAQLVGGTSAARVVAQGAIVDRSTPMAPALCVLIGNAQLDLAGTTSVIRIGAQPNKSVDGALPGPVDKGLADLVRRLEKS